LPAATAGAAAGQAPRCLREGDLIVFPQGDPHVLSSAPGMRAAGGHDRLRRPDAPAAEQLANAAGVSRSALAEGFTMVIGEPPMQYLAAWRIQLAPRLLRDARRR
jgi:AraC-like DNA-binding protein